jgi:Ca-activated chloride channel family protein
MRFANLEALQWLWVLPLFWVLVWVTEKQISRRLKKAFGKRLAPVLTTSVSKSSRWLKIGLRSFALGLFVIALARPQMGKGLQEVKAQGVELMIAIDVSTSMLTEDIKPSRLDHAKAEVSRLLDLLVGDKVGLVAFAGSAVLLSPLTTDKSALKMFLDSISTSSVETQGTDVHRALLEARGAFDRGGVESDEKLKVTRVILLASDGEDQEPGALNEAKKLAEDGTRIFTYAFGSERGGPIPLRDERGFMAGYKRDKAGQNILSTVKGDFLRDLAKAGHGAFYFSTPGGQEAQKIKADFDKLEKAEFSSSVAASYDEKFQIPLLASLVLLLIDYLIGESRRSGRIWRGRFEGTLAVLGVALAAGLTVPTTADAFELRGIIKNNSGAKKLESGQKVEANENLGSALVDIPFASEVHFNLANSFLLNQEFDKALSEYQQAIKLAPGTSETEKLLRFKSWFNSAVAQSELKKTDAALNSYQQALELQPESIEVKTNIELLTKSDQGGGGDGDQKNKDQKNGKDGKGNKSNDDNSKEKDKDQKGKGQDQQQSKDEKSENNKPQDPNPNEVKRQAAPRPFNSKEIGQQDVNRILEEIKNQEEQIRAKMQNEGAKDAPRDKDW